MNDLNQLSQQIITMFNNINWSPILPQIDNVITVSIDRNFSEVGRFGSENKYGGGRDKWKPSKRAIREKGQTLSKSSAGLASSIRVNVTQDNGKINIEIGSNKPYAAIHNFGGVTGRNHKTTLPARPFLVLQDEDIEEIQYIISEYLKRYFN